VACLVLACSAPQRAATPEAPKLVQPDKPGGADATRDAELATKAAPFVDAFLNNAARFSRDGKRVVFVSNRDGLPQVYVADASRSDSPARRLVEWPERMQLSELTPDGKAALVLADKGADENWSIWRVQLDGTANPVELTPGEPMQRDAALVADSVPDTLWFSGRKREEPGSAVYAASLSTPGPAREVYRANKPAFLVDVSRDGAHALVIRAPNFSEMSVIRVDLADGKATVLYPRDRKVSIEDARFSPDAKTVYVATDDGGEQAQLLALDATTGEERGRFKETEIPVGSFASLLVTKSGETVASMLDGGDRSVLRLLDAKTLKPRANVALPLGQGTLQGFTDDGKSLAVIWSTPDSPTDAWVVDTKTGAVARLRNEPRPSMTSAPPIQTSLVKIKAHDGLELPMIVQLPKGHSGRLPVIVSYHGGPASSSKVRWAPITAFFISQGYAWVEPNVRGSGGFGRSFEEADNGHARLEAFKDIETTGRWVASQPWADPDRVIVFGGSYGGYTVLIGLTRMPELWRAGVDLFGVANVNTLMSTTSGWIREVFHLEFGDPAREAAFFESISPLRDANRIVDPLFVYAGANDPRVPRSESDQIVRAVRVRKVPVEYMVAENEGHSLARRENLIEFLARSARFLETHAPERARVDPLGQNP
jgi:dipeptidyl aminopeptidase/acylaminoacyl peptidase